MSNRKTFDLQVHIRHPKSGRLENTKPYRLHISTEGKFFERDGKLYYENGEFYRDVTPEKKPAPKAQEDQGKPEKPTVIGGK